MFYYMKFRIGVCIPSSCLDSDMESVSEALSSSLKLNITVTHCRAKQTTPLTNHQIAGGLVFGSVLALVICATLIDCYKRKWQQEGKNEIVTLKIVVDDKLRSNQMGTKISMVASQSFYPQNHEVNGYDNDHHDNDRDHDDNDDDDDDNEMANNRQIQKHWSWLSFSLLTNFKLYFEHNTRPIMNSNQLDNNLKTRSQDCKTVPIIKCLNGIRVLSLCWVILANSYITLDPRATKRLTKTREAPKDFMFQIVVQASLAIETFFFLSGVLMSISFANRLKPADNKGDDSNKSDPSNKNSNSQRATQSNWLKWIQFYVHRYIRMTPATMLVIAFSMFAYRFGDGPLWFEATQKAHTSCTQNWWRHLLHVANFIDTRQMCFIHYWYIAADMQLFLFAPILMILIYQRRRIGYALVTLIGALSIVFVFYTTYASNLPPTLLFYNSDPESRREFGNTIMTKPLTHVLPYMVGMLLGKRLHESLTSNSETSHSMRRKSLTALLGSSAAMISLVEVFLPYKWNNSLLPTRFLAAVYAALFRFAWSLALAHLVISCRHKQSSKCLANEQKRNQHKALCSSCQAPVFQRKPKQAAAPTYHVPHSIHCQVKHNLDGKSSIDSGKLCMCGNGGNLVNRLLSLNVFTHLSKLSFVAYLIHLPLMSVFIGQTRGLFAFSHTLVIHLALSYLLMTLILSFILVHIIEFPFLTFEKYLFSEYLSKMTIDRRANSGNDKCDGTNGTGQAKPNTNNIQPTDWPQVDNLKLNLNHLKNHQTTTNSQLQTPANHSNYSHHHHNCELGESSVREPASRRLASSSSRYKISQRL